MLRFNFASASYLEQSARNFDVIFITLVVGFFPKDSTSDQVFILGRHFGLLACKRLHDLIRG
jgi:hypothetical protein